MLDVQTLRRLLSYDPETGVFVWNERTTRTTNIHVGDVAGTTNDEGYVRISIFKKAYLAHRLAWMYVYGDMPKLQLDHINGNRSDNRISNLREATSKQNSENKHGPHANNTHGWLGVSREGNKWKARVRANGKENYLGIFDTPEEAHAVYVKAKSQLHSFSTLHLTEAA